MQKRIKHKKTFLTSIMIEVSGRLLQDGSDRVTRQRHRRQIAHQLRQGVAVGVCRVIDRDRRNRIAERQANRR